MVPLARALGACHYHDRGDVFVIMGSSARVPDDTAGLMLLPVPLGAPTRRWRRHVEPTFAGD